MGIPKGYVRMKKGIIIKDDYLVSRLSNYEDYAKLCIGEKIPHYNYDVYRKSSNIFPSYTAALRKSLMNAFPAMVEHLPEKVEIIIKRIVRLNKHYYEEK